MKEKEDLKEYVSENKETLKEKICEALLMILNSRNDGNTYKIGFPQ